MKSNTVMTVASVIGMIFGIGYMLIPTTMLGFYGASTDAVGILLGRFFGGSMLGFAVLLWGQEMPRSRMRDAQLSWDSSSALWSRSP